MADPTPVGVLDARDRTPEQRQQRIDELLARIEDEQLVSGWVWAPMTETVSRLSGLGDDLSWLTIAYLACVSVRGDVMFRGASSQQTLVGPDTTYPPVPCRCGRDVPGARAQRRNGRDVVCVTCPGCGIDLVTYDGEPDPGRTLIAGGLG